MADVGHLITKADLIQADFDVLTQIELEPTANFSDVDQNDGTSNMTDSTTIHTAAHVTPSVAASKWLWWAEDSDGNVVPGETYTAQHPTFTFPYSGSWDVILLVTTNYGWQDAIRRTITIDITPTAAFTYETRNDGIQVHVTLQDASIADNNSTITSRIIDWGDGTPTESIGAQRFASHSYAQSATPVTIRLTVTTDRGESDFVDVVVTWGPENQFPLADFDWEQTGDLDFTFTDESTDSDGTIVAWNWKFGDGTSSTTQNPTHTFPGYETFLVTLKVTDNSGAVAIRFLFLDVEALDLAPVADFQWTVDSSGLIVTFTDTSTVSSGRSIVWWFWIFDDGEELGISTSPGNTVHTYLNFNAYKISLTIRDSAGQESTKLETITLVDPTPETAPTASFTVSTPVLLSREITDTSSAGSSAIVTWLYDWGDGTSNSYGSSANRTHAYAGTQLYAFSLTVTDSNGLSHTRSQTLDLRHDITSAISASFTISGCVVNSVI